jgi:hypothetical protein
VFVGNFGATEILIVLGLIVALFGIPRRSKLRRRAADQVDKTKNAVGAVKGEFLSGLRDEPGEAAVRDPVVGRAEPSRRKAWRPKRWRSRSR